MRDREGEGPRSALLTSAHGDTPRREDSIELSLRLSLFYAGLYGVIWMLSLSAVPAPADWYPAKSFINTVDCG